MNNIRAFIYQAIPKKYHQRLGRMAWLKPLRDLFFRNKKAYREHTTKISKQYGAFTAEFKFVSSIQIATKAKQRGVETTLLNNSIVLLQQYKPTKSTNYVIADVGANFGFLSLVWATTICKNGSVFSFEPHPKVYNSFTKAIALNQLESTITAERLAVGKKAGQIEISFAETTSNTIETVAEAREIQKKATTPLVNLDTYFNDAATLDLIKIDVDGIELDILHGATTLLDKLRPIVIVETNENKLICDFFFEREYRVFNMKLEEISDSAILPLNIFCVPK